MRTLLSRKTVKRRGVSRIIQLSIAGVTGHARTIVCNEAGRRWVIKTVQLLEERQAGVLSSVTDS